MLGRAIAAGLVPASVLSTMFKSMYHAQMSQRDVEMPEVTKNVMVFTIGDLYTLESPWNGPRPACKEGPYGDRPIYSTGLIEEAHRANFDVWVVSTKSRLDRWDAWWADPLRKDRIILSQYSDRMSFQELRLQPWFQLAYRLNAAWHLLTYHEEWGTEEFASRIQNAMAYEFREPEHVRSWLRHEHGVRFACDLAPEAPRARFRA